MKRLTMMASLVLAFCTLGQAETRLKWFSIVMMPPVTTSHNAPNFQLQPPQKITSKFEVTGQLLPASQADPFLCPSPNVAPCSTNASGDIWLDSATFTNVSASNCLVQVYDQQGTPVRILYALIPAYDGSTPAANNYVITWNARWAPGGIKWSACDAVSIIGYIRGMK